MKKILLCVAIGLFLGGCMAKLPTASPEVLSSLTNESNNLTMFSTTGRSLHIMSVKSVVGDGLAAMATKSQDLSPGEAIMQAYNVQNPSEQLREKFLRELEKNGVKGVKIDPAAYTENKAGTSSGYSLDVSVTAFTANYLPLNWQTYAVSVQGQGKLYSNIDGQVLWEGQCFHNGYKDKKLKMDVTEFEANDASKVKELLDYGTSECSKTLAASLFNIAAK